MKNYFKVLGFSIVLLVIQQETKAIPAYPFPITVMQPDGSSITLRQYGDEFMNYITTDDGYTVVTDSRGFYVYAQMKDGQIIPTNYVAQNTAQRSQTEKKLLAGLGRHLHSPAITPHRLHKSTNANYSQNGLLRKTKGFDYSKFRGLIILVEFSDRKFEKEDSKQRITAMVNQKDYSADGSSGSVNNYFYDNSMGKFDPEFDVVGPVTINYRQTDARQTANTHQLAIAACTAVNEFVNYKNYDLDGDNQVDMVYFIFAGAGSHVGGNNANYIWPHASTLPSSFFLDNVSLGRYACSVELNGLEGSHVQDGIGTMVHEFSHVLGLKDYYDVDYNSSGGESEHPNSWSVMASGSYYNRSKTPCNYSLYERYALGWAIPQLISGDGTHLLAALDASNRGYRINSAIEEEFFLLENRQQNKWDKYLPGHGMLVFRVDSTDTNAWISNRVNVDPKHLHYELLRSQKTIQSATLLDAATDPFPGSANITSLTNQTSPSISSWSGLQSETTVINISESSDGKIQFTTKADVFQAYREDFENMEVTTTNTKNVQGKFSKWDFSKALVQVPGSDKANGMKAIGIYKGGELKANTPIEKNINSASFRLWNPTKVPTTVRLYYSVNKGISWTPATNSSNSILANVDAGETSELTFNINSKQSTMYKIGMISGGSSTDEMNYIDDFTLKYNDNTPPLAVISTKSETENNLFITRDGATLSVTSAQNTPIYLYTVNGILIESQNPQNGKAVFRLPYKGLYIIRQNEKSMKVIY